MSPQPGWGSIVSLEGAPGWARGYDVRPVAVSLAGLDLATTHDHGSAVTLSRIRGWFEPAPDATSRTEHPTGDGDIRGMLRLGVRTIELRGMIVAGGMDAALEAVARLSGVREGELVVHERGRGIARVADVRRADIELTEHAPAVWSYILALVADDPLRYSTVVQALAGGAQVLVSRGDVMAWPTIDLVGPHSALSITHPGGTWTLPALSSGQSRRVDCRDGVVWNAATGARMSGAAAGSGPWPRVPAGGASWSVSGLGSGVARVRRFEAWS